MAGVDSDYLGGVLPGTTGNLDPSTTNQPAGAAGLAVGTGTGRFGIVPLAAELGGDLGTVVNDFWDWLKTPFGPISPLNLSIIVGVLFLAIFGWNLFLYHVRIAAEAI